MYLYKDTQRLEKSNVFQTIRFCRLGQSLVVQDTTLILLGIVDPCEAVSDPNLLRKTIHLCLLSSIVCFREW